MDLNRDEVKTAIMQSQHCQRNWDLSKQIPEEDIATIISAVTQCPSKQNIAHYNVHVITSRNVIEEIHTHTRGFSILPNEADMQTNSQVLANLLLVFEEIDIEVVSKKSTFRNTETRLIASGQANARIIESMKRDRLLAVGIASGYANLVSNMLGYNTGYCACFESEPIQKILGTQNNIMLMLGIGFKNENIDRKKHQYSDFVYPPKIKQKIEIFQHK